MKQPALPIVIVDDEVIRPQLRSLLSLEQDCRMMGEAGSAAEALSLVERQPHIVILDVELSDASSTRGPESTRSRLAAPHSRAGELCRKYHHRRHCTELSTRSAHDKASPRRSSRDELLLVGWVTALIDTAFDLYDTVAVIVTSEASGVSFESL